MNFVGLANTLYLLMSLGLVGAGLTVVYLALSGHQVVVYRRGVLALGASLLLLVAGWVLSDAVFYGFVESWLLLYVAFVVFVSSSIVHLYAVWHFSRDFVATKGEDASVQSAAEYQGGFDTDER